ncbi:Hsp33 family molecular chaperone HslO [Mesorhizobium sp. M2A.F.Ca.ET.042.01.1.1]|uniref:Hsp33 family molecular chaperone HslO n=1 Tax=Mesorhizobium sp. M2A.F.Ca.ET.042.01.1.1 TaxID=2496745 RepID=UPI001FDFC42C|nr:Hsp33 family molecular chaperone HslO [Mesorhizobium sp. M2A.F.Ca.ET.042.01.1.1]
MLETQTLAEHKPQLGEFGFAGDDHVVPYEVAPLDVRGRTVQLGPMLDAILSRHNYPEPVARQQALLGNGVLALTIDQGAHTQRYQGIVQLDGTSLEDAARTYFRQSEQIPTDIKMSVAKLVTPGPGGAHEQWRAGGILAQFLPQAPERMRIPDISGGDGDDRELTDHPADNSWQELLALLGTIEPTELIDPTVGAERLLYRLFHEHGVRVFRSVPVDDQCSCSREKIHGILQGFSAEEIKDSTEEGGIHVACEFCSTQYDFDPAEFAAE